MGFRLRKDARHWFSSIESSLSSSAKRFDIYYFCLAAGLSYGRKGEVLGDNSDIFIDYFPGEFRSRSRILIAWLISVELESLGISVSERGEVHGVIRQLVDPQSPNFLSDEGLAKLNQYASGGFEIISDEVGEPPRALPLFLMKLHKIVGGGWE